MLDTCNQSMLIWYSGSMDENEGEIVAGKGDLFPQAKEKSCKIAKQSVQVSLERV